MEEFEVSDASKKTKTVYISTIISIALVLLMLGLLGLVLVHAKNLSNYVKENIVLNNFNTSLEVLSSMLPIFLVSRNLSTHLI